MTVYLAQLCDAANHELEECAVTGRVHLQPMPQNQPVWVQIDLAIVQTMFANLFSNSLRANPAAKITISCTGRTLKYHDGRIWPEAPAPSWLVFRHRKPLPTVHRFAVGIPLRPKFGLAAGNRSKPGNRAAHDVAAGTAGSVRHP